MNEIKEKTKQGQKRKRESPEESNERDLLKILDILQSKIGNKLLTEHNHHRTTNSSPCRNRYKL